MHLPIAERELRIAARSSRTYRGRMVACIIFSAMSLWMLWAARTIFRGQQAIPIAYGYITSIALMMCMFSCNVTADAISSEKRGGTLGFLFLTDLKGIDVVFGKLAASGLMAFYGLLAIIPALAMPVLMGGIPGESVFRTTVTLMNAMFFSLSMGLWISARSWDQKKANGAAVWVAIIFLWAFPAVAELVEKKYHWYTAAKTLRVFSPMYQLQKAGPYGIGMLRDQFWFSVALLHGLAWLALWRACRIVPHRWQDRVPPISERLADRWNRWRLGPLGEREVFRRRLIALNPMHWLSSRDRFGPLGIWLILLIILAVWIGLWTWVKIVSRGGGPPFWGIGIPLLFLSTIVMRLKSAVLAGEVLTRDRLSGALELLLSTSLSLKEVSSGIWMTARRHFLGPAIAILLTASVIFLFGLAEANRNADPKALPIAHMIFFGLIGLFVLDLVASVWTGMWISCCVRQPNALGGMCLLRLLALPWGIFFTVMSTTAYFRLQFFSQSFPRVFGMWLFFCVANDVFWIIWSRRKFYENIRTAAAERFIPEESISWWKFWRKPARG